MGTRDRDRGRGRRDVNALGRESACPGVCLGHPRAAGSLRYRDLGNHHAPSPRLIALSLLRMGAGHDLFSLRRSKFAMGLTQGGQSGAVLVHLIQLIEPR